MKSKGLILPQSKNYDEAYRLAAEQLAGMDNIEQQCHRSGAEYRPIGAKKTIVIEYLNRSHLITLPSIEISLIDSAEPVAVKDKVLILHYLLNAKGTPLADRLITFRELPEGSVYSPTFAQRTVKPLVDSLGQAPHLLVNIAAKLGGRKVDYGDTAVTINAFRCVPITIVLWQGDEELPPQGNILFDATISDYLPTEDITVLCETITWKLIKYKIV